MKANLTIASCLLAAGLLGPAAVARAQGNDPMSARLSAETAGDIEPGLYSAGEGRDFSLQSYHDKFLLRFQDTPESFVLSVDPVSLGAKLLKYDTGATALRVSVWGGLTLYAADVPNGLPATRQGDISAAMPAVVSVADLHAALNDESSHFSYANKMALHFATDAGTLSDADARAMAFDTLGNTQLGIERFIAAPPARQALGKRIDTVKIEAGAKPGLALAGRSLLVSFAPNEGFSGRTSSHAIAHALGKLLAVSTPE